MRPFGTLVTGLAGLALWAMLLSLAGRNVGDRQTETFEIEDMSTDWAEPATASDPAPASGTAEIPPAEETVADASLPRREAAHPVSEADAGGTEPDPPDGPGVRPVNPALFASPLMQTAGAVERVEPREPREPPAKKEPERIQVVLLARPESVEAGLIAFGPRNLKLADIASTDRVRVCPASKGADWPCGMVARTQQRLFLRNRTIACDADSADWQGTIEARCRVGELDIAKWLAENGWAEAPEGSPFAALTEKARRERRGIFGDDPR